jgi:cytochrome c
MRRRAHPLQCRGILIVTLSLIALPGISGMFAMSGLASDPKERGKALVEELCAGCHAVGRSGESPVAGAPAFRMLSRRFDMNELMDRMEQGLSSAHAEMPAFHFKRDDARAVRVYLNSIQD